jgi:hypothetical protein
MIFPFILVPAFRCYAQPHLRISAPLRKGRTRRMRFTAFSVHVLTSSHGAMWLFLKERATRQHRVSKDLNRICCNGHTFCPLDDSQLYIPCRRSFQPSPRITPRQVQTAPCAASTRSSERSIGFFRRYALNHSSVACAMRSEGRAPADRLFGFFVRPALKYFPHSSATRAAAARSAGGGGGSRIIGSR